MKHLPGLLLLGLALVSCTKEDAYRNTKNLLSDVLGKSSAIRKSTPVTFHLVSVQIAGGTGGWWTLNDQQLSGETEQMLQQWFQQMPSAQEPNVDSNMLYISHSVLQDVPGQEEPASYEDGQLNIQLIKQSERTKVIDGVPVVTQRGKWELRGAFGIYSHYKRSVGGHYTYTFTPQEPAYYYIDGVAYPYGETKREVFLKGVLQQ